jgi:RNA-directed DNA polymerase
MERRGPQKPTRSIESPTGHCTGELGKTTQDERKFGLQLNSWMRIGIKAKDSSVVFHNLLCHYNRENFLQAFKALQGNKACGIDGTSKKEYGEKLDENLGSLIQNIHRGTYRPKPKKRVFIPKPNGDKRPIAISSFEDKLVEWVTAKILNSIYDSSFIRTSFGFREKKSAHDAIETCYQSLKKGNRSYVVEIDLKGFFDSISHRRLIKILENRISDKRFTSLISRFLQVGILEQTLLKISDQGTPQGAIMSPVLANIFLHHCIDSWFKETTRKQNAVIVRYADDAVFFFETKFESENFFTALKARVELFGLELNDEKSGIISFKRSDKTVFHFLGFTLFWGKARKYNPRASLRVKTNLKTLFKKIAEYSSWIKRMRARAKLSVLWQLTAAKLRGHYQYYGFMCNREKLNHYYKAVTWNLYRWLNRRSQRRSMTWKQFQHRLLRHPLPTPPLVEALKPLDRWSVYALQ